VFFGNKTRIITNFHTTMELERIFEEVRVDQASGKVSLVDVAAIVTGKDGNCAAETIRCILGRDLELVKLCQHTRINGKGRPTPVTSKVNCVEFVKRFIAMNRTTREQKLSSASQWGIDAECFSSYIEPEILRVLVAAFRDYQPQCQYSVGSYRVDLYLEGPRIVIECDEYNHLYYDGEYEVDRVVAITNKLNCRWVRFNPNVPNFNIGVVICDVFTMLQ